MQLRKNWKTRKASQLGLWASRMQLRKNWKVVLVAELSPILVDCWCNSERIESKSCSLQSVAKRMLDATQKELKGLITRFDSSLKKEQMQLRKNWKYVWDEAGYLCFPVDWMQLRKNWKPECSKSNTKGNSMMMQLRKNWKSWLAALRNGMYRYMDATQKELKVSLSRKLSHGDKPPDATQKELKVHTNLCDGGMVKVVMQLRKNWKNFTSVFLALSADSMMQLRKNWRLVLYLIELARAGIWAI